jgi:two-component system chemotaxis response regulator CheB
MVVDDAVVVRGLIARWIDEEPGLEVVATLRTGREAVDQIESLAPDVVVLDLEMPELDGISALPLLLAKRPDLVVIVASTLTRRNAEISFKALSLGALDYVPKPDTVRGVTTSAEFRNELVQKVRHLGARRERLRATPRRDAPGSTLAERPIVPAVLRPDPRPAPLEAPGSLKLRPFPPISPRVLVVGASTGGPQAVMRLLAQLGDVVERAPVLITQHMPMTFTTIFAEHISRVSGRPAGEGRDGEAVRAGRIYIAPGGMHMRVTRKNGTAVIVLDDGPAVNFCKPAVDPLFSSAATIWSNWVLGVVLTGMGVDGRLGATNIVKAGGSVIAQDEATSVVWGMPGAVAAAGLCSAVLPLDRIAPSIVRLFAGERP